MAGESITLEDVRVTVIVTSTIAILTTTFRLYDRTRRGKLWWDDAWAFISMLFTIMFMTAILLHCRDPTTMSQSVKIAVYYMCALLFYCVVWSARLSILYTVKRISPPGMLRTLLGYVVIFAVTCFSVLFAQVFWVCEKEAGWKDQLNPQCVLGEEVAIVQVITDVIIDTILVLAPVKLIWRVDLSKSQKIMLIAVFSSSAVTTTVSLIHAVAILRVGGFIEVLCAIVEDSVSLIIANLSVIVACMFRIKTDEGDGSRGSGNLHLHGVTTKNRIRNRADPLSTIATVTYDEGLAIGVSTTKTIHIDDTPTHVYGKKNKLRDVKQQTTFELKPFSQSNDSSTLVDDKK